MKLKIDKSEQDVKSELVKEIGDYQIYRTETVKVDAFTGKAYGHTKVYYDVCCNEDLLESYKTLKEAVKACR